MTNIDPQIEQSARAAARADGLNPNTIVAGIPAWRHYIVSVRKQPKVKPVPPAPSAIDEATRAIFTAASERRGEYNKLEKADRDATRILDKSLRGLIIEASDGVRHKIEYVNVWQGVVRVRGKRYKTDGTLSRFDRDIGAINQHSFVAPGEVVDYAD